MARFAPAVAALWTAVATYAQSPFQESTVAVTRIGDSARPVAADFDGDGHVDVIMLPSPDLGVAIFRGLGAGAFSGPERPNPVEQSVTSFAVGDVDGDGAADIVQSTLTETATSSQAVKSAPLQSHTPSNSRTGRSRRPRSSSQGTSAT